MRAYLALDQANGLVDAGVRRPWRHLAGRLPRAAPPFTRTTQRLLHETLRLAIHLNRHRVTGYSALVWNSTTKQPKVMKPVHVVDPRSCNATQGRAALKRRATRPRVEPR